MQNALVQQLLEERVLQAARAAEDAVDDELHRMENMTQARRRARRGSGSQNRGRDARAGATRRTTWRRSSASGWSR